MSDAYSQAADLLERAAQLDRQARSDEALALLENYAEWPAPYNERGLLLRAAILAPLDPIRALDELPEDAGEFATADGRIGWFLTSARAYMHARNWRKAQDLLDAAGVEMGQDNPQHYWLAYLRAYMQWSQRDYEPSSPRLKIAEQNPDIAQRFFAVNLRAWMHAGREDYGSMSAALRECILLYERHREQCGIRAVASSLQSLLALAWEIADLDAAADGRRAFETIQWTPNIRRQRFLCIRALSWSAFLSRDIPAMQRFLDAECDEAPTPAWRVMAHLDRAYIHRLSSCERLAAAEVENARDIASAVDWDATRNEERMALLMLAVLLAPSDCEAAAQYSNQYARLHAHSLAERLEASHEPRRVQAMQRYAEGRIAQMRGNAPLAIRLLESAYNVFSSIRYAFRAALTAQALYEITADERWIAAAVQHASAFPNSAIARKLFEMRGAGG